MSFFLCKGTVIQNIRLIPYPLIKHTFVVSFQLLNVKNQTENRDRIFYCIIKTSRYSFNIIDNVQTNAEKTQIDNTGKTFGIVSK